MPLLEIFYILFGAFIIVAIIIYQFKVNYKYLFKYASTKVDNKAIRIKKRVIPFTAIKCVYAEEVDINFAERFLVSRLFFKGVSKMILNLNNNTTEIIVLPTNYIILFCKKLKDAGVEVIGC